MGKMPKVVVKYLYCRCGQEMDNDSRVVIYPSGKRDLFLWCDACGFRAQGYDAEALVRAFQEDLI